MLNWELTDKRIYQLLKHPYQVDNSIVKKMTSAYLEFVEELFAYLNEGKDDNSQIKYCQYRICDYRNRLCTQE